MATKSPDTPDIATINAEMAILQAQEASLAADPTFTPDQLIACTRFAQYPQPVLRALLTQPSYTMADAEAVVTAYLGTGGN